MRVGDHQLGLPGLFHGYHGIVMGVSAGSMNAAHIVYAAPEEPGEAADPHYSRWMNGLGLTETRILPHYQFIRDHVLDGQKVEDMTSGRSVTLTEIGTASMCGNTEALVSTVTNSSPFSPPPFMVGAAEVEVDLETGEAKVIDYAAAVDCGTPVNPNLARVQAEGGILQGIGMALTENITYNKKGKLAENSLMQYKIPTRVDIGHIRVEFESSYEDAGPFGAKSIGEVVINTPLPAVSDAIFNATGTRFYELPITPEKIAMAVAERKAENE